MTEATVIALDPNVAMVIMGVIGIIVPMATLLVNFIQNRSIAKDQKARDYTVAAEVKDVAATVAVKVEESRLGFDEKLDVIYTACDGRLTEALNTIKELKKMLEKIAPNDPRVQDLVR